MEKIILLHTNDLHSHLENWPKIRRFLLNRKQEEASGKRSSRSILAISLIGGIR